MKFHLICIGYNLVNIVCFTFNEIIVLTFSHKNNNFDISSTKEFSLNKFHTLRVKMNALSFSKHLHC